MFLLVAVSVFSEKETVMAGEATVTLFASFADYQKKNGQEIGEYVQYTLYPMSGHCVLKVSNSQGKIDKHDLDLLWGYTIGNDVYRVNKVLKEGPARVMQMGTHVYYERGTIHMQLVNSDRGYSDDSDLAFFSQDLESEIVKYKKFLKILKNDPKNESYRKCLKKAHIHIAKG